MAADHGARLFADGDDGVVALGDSDDGRLVEDLGSGWKMTKSNDQHCYVEYPEGADIRIGDILSFGISHTSTAFDKWDVVWRIADDFRVTGAVKTFF